jgi:hypothetical protein
MHSIEKTCWATGAGPKSASETSAASVDDKMKSRKPVAKPEDPAKASPTLAKKISGTSAGWSVRGSFTPENDDYVTLRTFWVHKTEA